MGCTLGTTKPVGQPFEPQLVTFRLGAQTRATQKYRHQARNAVLTPHDLTSNLRTSKLKNAPKNHVGKTLTNLSSKGRLKATEGNSEDRPRMMVRKAVNINGAKGKRQKSSQPTQLKPSKQYAFKGTTRQISTTRVVRSNDTFHVSQVDEDLYLPSDGEDGEFSYIGSGSGYDTEQRSLRSICDHVLPTRSTTIQAQAEPEQEDKIRRTIPTWMTGYFRVKRSQRPPQMRRKTTEVLSKSTELYTSFPESKQRGGSLDTMIQVRIEKEKRIADETRREMFRDQLKLMRQLHSWEDIPLAFFIDKVVDDPSDSESISRKAKKIDRKKSKMRRRTSTRRSKSRTET